MFSCKVDKNLGNHKNIRTNGSFCKLTKKLIYGVLWAALLLRMCSFQRISRKVVESDFFVMESHENSWNLKCQNIMNPVTVFCVVCPARMRSSERKSSVALVSRTWTVVSTLSSNCPVMSPMTTKRWDIAVISTWLNSSQRSRVGVLMNKSARGWSVKRFELSNGLDTALHKTYSGDYSH